MFFLCLLIILVSFFYLSVGSLLNVIIYRLPIMLHNEFQSECCELLLLKKPKIEDINLFLPRSFCTQCHCLVRAWQNIPLLSYLFLRGRCHQCKVAISIRYPLVELLTLVCSLYATWHFGFSLALLFSLLAIWILITLVFIDLDHQILPDSLTLSLLWLGLIANTQQLFTDLNNAVLSAAGAYLSLWLCIKIYYLFTAKVGMGNGDFKLFAALGAWFGWTQLPIILLCSSLSGLIYGLFYLSITHKSKETPIPFGPFLCISGMITLFWGKALLSFYF